MVGEDFRRIRMRVRKAKEDIEDGANQVVQRKLEEMEQSAKANIVAQGAVWRYDLIKSITYRKSRMGDVTRHRLFTDPLIAPHAPFVEFGTGLKGRLTDPFPDNPGFRAPSFSAELEANIREWVETKPVIPRTPGMSREDLAYAIARSIARYGTRAQPFWRPAWYEIEFDLKRSVRREVADEVGDI